MAKYNGQNNQVVTTSDELARGGEGIIFTIDGTPNVAKVFYPTERSTARKQKLSHMISLKSIPQRAVWPKEIISEGGDFAGYTMHRITDCKEIREIYTADDQIGDLEFRLAVAHYLCDAVDEIHSLGQVCGDLNPKNILVDKRGHVTLVDTDSFHIQNPKNLNRPFRCEKTLPEYVAPELQKKMVNGQNLAIAKLPTFTKETDLFAVAVHIFALVMNGCHPFSSRLSDLVITQRRSSVSAPQPIDNIKNGFSPFFMNNNDLDIPKYAPPIASLPNEIQDMFSRSFIDGHKDPSNRPTCKEWAVALKKWRNDIVSQKSVNINTPPYSSDSLRNNIFFYYELVIIIFAFLVILALFGVNYNSSMHPVPTASLSVEPTALPTAVPTISPTSIPITSAAPSMSSSMPLSKFKVVCSYYFEYSNGDYPYSPD